MKKIFTFYLLLTICFACTPQKKLNRLLKKYPELITSTTTIDTIYTQTRYHDSIITLKDIVNSHDTIFITKNNVITKIFHKNDSIFVSSKCPPDTIVYQRTINNVTGNKNNTWLQNHTELLLGALIMLCIAFAFSLIINKTKHV